MENAPLIALLVLVVAVLVWRALTKDRAEYARFKRLRSTVQRQKMYRKWLVDAVVVFGGMSLVVGFAAWAHIGPALAAAQAWEPVAALRRLLATDLGTGVAIGAGVAFAVGLFLPVLLLGRRPVEELAAVGDVQALIPRSKPEVGYGAGMSLSAGVFEELLFRLGLPAALFGATGDAVISFSAPIVLFGLLHVYQGWAGVIAATVAGLLLTLVYLLSGSILLAVVVHAALDLRSLVLLPLVLRPWQRPAPEGGTARIAARPPSR